MLLNANPAYLENEAHHSPDNCKSCHRILMRGFPEEIKKDAEEYGYNIFTSKDTVNSDTKRTQP